MTTQHSTESSKYLMKNLKEVLPRALQEVCQARPPDPIEFLAKCLYRAADCEMYYHEKAIFAKEMQLMTIQMKRDDENRQNAVTRHKRHIHELRQILFNLEAEPFIAMSTKQGAIRRKRMYRSGSIDRKDSLPHEFYDETTSSVTKLSFDYSDFSTAETIQRHLAMGLRDSAEPRSAVSLRKDSTTRTLVSDEDITLERSLSMQSSRSDTISKKGKVWKSNRALLESENSPELPSLEKPLYEKVMLSPSSKNAALRSKRAQSIEHSEIEKKKKAKTKAMIADNEIREEQTEIPEKPEYGYDEAVEEKFVDPSSQTRAKVPMGAGVSKSVSDLNAEEYNEQEEQSAIGLEQKTRKKAKHQFPKSAVIDDDDKIEKAKVSKEKKPGKQKDDTSEEIELQARLSESETLLSDDVQKPVSRKTKMRKEEHRVFVKSAQSEVLSSDAFKTDDSKTMLKTSVSSIISHGEAEDIQRDMDSSKPDSVSMKHKPKRRRPSLVAKKLTDNEEEAIDIKIDTDEVLEDTGHPKIIKKRLKKKVVRDNDEDTSDYDEGVKKVKKIRKVSRKISGTIDKDDVSRDDSTDALRKKTKKEGMSTRDSEEEDRSTISIPHLEREFGKRKSSDRKNVRSKRAKEHSITDSSTLVQLSQTDNRSKEEDEDKDEDTDIKKKGKRRIKKHWSTYLDGDDTKYNELIKLSRARRRARELSVPGTSSSTESIGAHDFDPAKFLKKDKIPFRKMKSKGSLKLGSGRTRSERLTSSSTHQASDLTELLESTDLQLDFSGSDMLVPGRSTLFTHVECEWFLVPPRVLVCNHPVLGEIRAYASSTSQSKDSLTEERMANLIGYWMYDEEDMSLKPREEIRFFLCFVGWPDRAAYTWQAFYDPEVYTVIDPVMDDIKYKRRGRQL